MRACAEIDSLWLSMTSIYGHRWISAYGADAQQGAGDAWARGLAGITARQLGVGIDACIVSADPWPPTLPQFRALCFAIPALPVVRLRFNQHLRSRESLVAEPFDRLIWQFIDAYRVRQVSADQTDRMLRDAYELAREHVMAGGELPEPSAEIEHKPEPAKPGKPVSPEELARIFETTREMLAEVEEPQRAAAPKPSTSPEVKAALEAEARERFAQINRRTDLHASIVNADGSVPPIDRTPVEGGENHGSAQA